MESMRNRAKGMFPMVLLTLLSIVQALALEFLWDHMRHRGDLFELSLAVIPGWLQIAVMFNLIIIIWLMYAGMLMRFRWTPTTMDSIFPFLAGGWIGLSNYHGLFTVVVLIAIFIGLGYETHKTAAYWKVSMAGET